MIDRKFVILGLVAVATLASFYAYEKPSEQQEPVGELDMTCGFTSDFAAFLKKSKQRTIKTIRSGTSSATTSNAPPLEARPAALRSWRRHPLSSSTATATSASDEAAKTATSLGRPASGSSPPSSALRATKKPNSTRRRGALRTPTPPPKTTTPKSTCCR
jgi:hypothetical protein